MRKFLLLTLVQTQIPLSSRFVLTLQNVVSPDEKAKAMLVPQGHKDAEKPLILHDGSTLKHSSVRLILRHAGIAGSQLLTQDINM